MIKLFCLGLSPEEAKAARGKLLVTEYAGCRRVFLSSSSNTDAPLFAVGANDGAGVDAGADGAFRAAVVRAHVSPAAAAILPVLKVLHESLGGVRSCGYTLVKSVRTSTNAIRGPELGPNTHARGSRWDFGENLVPSLLPELDSEVFRVMPCLIGRFGGACVYVPTPEVSMADLTVRLGEAREHLYRDACLAVKQACEGGGLKGVVRYCMKMSEENSAR